MKALPLLLAFALLPASTFAGTPLQKNCADVVKDEVTRALSGIGEFASSGLKVKAIATTFTGDRDQRNNQVVLAKAYFASETEEDPANFERYKFTVLVQMGGNVVTGTGGPGCRIVSAVQKTLK